MAKENTGQLSVPTLSLQCQDLPGSQSSSPLSQMDSYTGRSMDPLLPMSEPTRKKVPDTDYDGSQRYQSERHRSHVCLGSSLCHSQYIKVSNMWRSGHDVPMPVSQNTCFLQEFYEERHREPRLTLRPPSLAAPYAPVQNWHHQPEKLIFESCAYEASVRSRHSCSRNALLFGHIH